MNSALLSQIQSGKGLKKVPAHAKNDRSEVKGSGNVVGASNNNSQGKQRELTAFCYNLFIGASRGPPMPPGGGRKGIHDKLNAQFGGSSIPSKPSGYDLIPIIH